MRKCVGYCRSEAVRLILSAALAGAGAIAWPAAEVVAQTAATYQVGQNIQVREGDSWSAATIVKKEGRKYLIHYADSDSSSDEWVGTDRMRASGSTGNTGGSGGGANSGSAPNPPPAPAAPPADNDTPPPSKPRHHFGDHHNDDTAETVIAQTTPNLDAVADETLAKAPPGWASPDLSGIKGEVHAYPLSVKSADHDMGVQQILICQGGGVVVGFSTFGEKARMVQRVGAAAGSVRLSIPPQCLPLAASPTGKVLICRSNKFGFGNNGRIDAFTLARGTSDATPLVSFTPYPSGGDGKPEDIRFAAALTDSRIITCDSKGRIIAWDIASGSVTGVWRVNVGDMHFGGWGVNLALSPDGAWLAAASNAGITTIDTDSGRVLGMIPNPSGHPLYDLACSPTGKTLVARHGDDALASYDLASGKELRTVALPQKMIGTLVCPDDGFVLVNNQNLLDANTGAAIPAFHAPPGTNLAVAGAAVTWIASDERVEATHIPDEDTRAAAKAVGESALALKPGMSVRLDIQVDFADPDKADVEAAIRKKLTDDGLTIADSADTVVVCRTEPGAQHEHYYAKARPGMPMFMGMGGGGATSVILTDKVTRITLQQNGQTFWEEKRTSGPANFIPIKDGQSIEDAANATIKYDPKFLEDVMIPPYIAKSN